MNFCAIETLLVLSNEQITYDKTPAVTMCGNISSSTEGNYFAANSSSPLLQVSASNSSFSMSKT